MTNSLSTAEKLLYSTVKITAFSNGEPIGTGTGFFTIFNKTHDSNTPVLITNKHVVFGADKIRIKCHTADQDKPYGKLIDVDINLDRIVVDHPDKGIDLCAIFINPIAQHALSQQTPIFYVPITMDLIPDDNDWQYFDAIEKVTMVGCPNGLSDTVNNFPIVRQGITATSPSKPYNGKEEFMVDMACFPGSSGSPVFLYNDGDYLDRKTGSRIIGGTRLKLLGVLYAGPQFTSSGQIILNKGSHFKIDSMMHLGIVVKSSELKVLESLVLEILKDY